MSGHQSLKQRGQTIKLIYFHCALVAFLITVTKYLTEITWERIYCDPCQGGFSPSQQKSTAEFTVTSVSRRDSLPECGLEPEVGRTFKDIPPREALPPARLPPPSGPITFKRPPHAEGGEHRPVGAFHAHAKILSHLLTVRF